MTAYNILPPVPAGQMVPYGQPQQTAQPMRQGFPGAPPQGWPSPFQPQQSPFASRIGNMGGAWGDWFSQRPRHSAYDDRGAFRSALGDWLGQRPQGHPFPNGMPAQPFPQAPGMDQLAAYHAQNLRPQPVAQPAQDGPVYPVMAQQPQRPVNPYSGPPTGFGYGR